MMKSVDRPFSDGTPGRIEFIVGLNGSVNLNANAQKIAP
jgi:hypothetical protein